MVCATAGAATTTTAAAAAPALAAPLCTLHPKTMGKFFPTRATAAAAAALIIGIYFGCLLTLSFPFGSF